VRALDARCPHFGADLGKGTVVGEHIRCAFHHRQFAAGDCKESAARFYPVEEKWGYIWLWNGPEVAFPLPEISRELRVIRVPAQVIRCHPHVLTANGLDIDHFSAVHRLDVEVTAVRSESPHSIGIDLRGRPASALMRRLTGTLSSDFEASIDAIGGHISLSRVHKPVEFAIMYNGKITNRGYSDTTTILFLPRMLFPDCVRAILVLLVATTDDRRILHDIEFPERISEIGTPLAKFVDSVNTMKTW
jgi:phenylpropionate dioxygenase-like ring-hydroxylating dioxygenase large terminal subunit